MSNAIKVAVPLFLLAALAGGAAYYVTQTGSEPVPTPHVAPQVPKEPEPKPEPIQPVTPAAAPTRQDPDRTQVVANTSASDAPQGVKGRLLLPDGRPAAGVPVLLIENLMSNPINVFLMNKTAKSTAASAAASSTTADDGSFALGVRQVGKTFDLRVVSNDHPERNVPQIKVREGDWFDTGDLRLEVGLVVQGYVVEEESKVGVAGATVYLVDTNQLHARIATPGRERGIQALTDTKGFFRFTAAPTQGLVNITAEAEGYASSPLVNQQLKPLGLNEFQIQMVRGQPIAGIVVDPEGKPVAGAALTATGLSQKTPQVATAASGPDGTFAFPSLRTGPYNLVASMAGFVDAREQAVMSGDQEVKLVLGTRPSVKLRVLGQNRAPVKSYRVALMRYFPNNPSGIGKVLDFPDRSVTPADYPSDLGGEWALIRNVPPGDFRWQIQDSAHAKTLSPPFTVVEGGPIQEVTAELTLGGVLTGTVIDDRGRPVADANVATDMNSGPAADLGLFDVFRSMMPEKHSKAQTKTDAQGRFRISKLAFADYMVRVSHPDYCEGTAIDIKLETPGQVVDVGVVKLSVGAIVEGIASVGGQPMGQIKIQVSTPLPQVAAPQPGQPAPPVQPLGPMFHAQVMSDGDGRFRLLKRVPPGTYRVTASRQTAENPFMGILDQKDTEQQMVVRPGQDRIEINFNLARR